MAGVARDIGTFFRSTAVYGLVGAVHSLGEFLLLPLYARFLLPTEFGIFDVTLVYLALLTIIVSFELTNGAFRFHFDADDINHHRRLASSVTLYLGSVAVVALLVVTPLAPSLSKFLFGTTAHYMLFLLAGLFLVFQSLYTFPLNMLRLQQRPVTYTIISLVQVGISISGTIVFLGVLQMGVQGILLAKVISTIPTLVTCFWLQRAFLRPLIDWSLIRRLLAYSAPLIPAGSVIWLVHALNRSALLRHTDLTQLGLFALASKFTVIVTLAVIAVQRAWPQFAFANMTDPRARFTLARIFNYYVAGAFGLVLIISLAGVDLLRLQSATAYLSAARYILPLALGMLLYGCFYLFTTGAAATKTTTLILPPVVTGLGVNLIANSILAPQYGALAVAWVTPLTYATMAGIMLRNAQKVFPIPYTWGAFLRVCCVGCGLCFGTSLIPQNPWVFSLALKAVIVVIYPVLLRVVGFFGRDEIDHARHLLRFRRPGESRPATRKVFSPTADNSREAVESLADISTDADRRRSTPAQTT